MFRPRIAVIGAGAWGMNHVRAVASEPACELAAVADPDPAALARARALQASVEIHQDPDSIMDRGDIDAVIIASPAATHTPLACRALAAGKHVLVEKPASMSVEEGRTLAAAAGSSRGVLAVGHLLVHHPAVVALREIVRSGTLGSLGYIHGVRASTGRIRADESALWSLGPHDISVLDFVLGSHPVSVSAHGRVIHHAGVEDVVTLTLRYPAGEIATLLLSRVHPRKERLLTLVGNDKLVEFDDVSHQRLRIHSRTSTRPREFTEFSQFLSNMDGDVHIPHINIVEPLRAQLNDLVACIVEQRAPRADVFSALRVLAVLDAAQRSLAADGATIAVA